MTSQIPVVDDERAVRRALFSPQKQAIPCVQPVRSMKPLIFSQTITLILSSAILDAGDTGLTFEENTGQTSNTVVIIMTGQGSIPDAINAI